MKNRNLIKRFDGQPERSRDRRNCWLREFVMVFGRRGDKQVQYFSREGRGIDFNYLIEEHGTSRVTETV